MNILVANDDGIEAQGLRVLAQELGTAFDVYVVAPDRERSSVGHALTLHKPLRVTMVKDLPGAKKAWKVNGTPSDCVKLGTQALLKKVDLVVAGINRGPNLGTDVLYSGTVAAAVEGSILGIPSLAVSITSYEEVLDFLPAAKVVKKLIEKVSAVDIKEGMLLNINVPKKIDPQNEEVVLTHLGIRRYKDTIVKRVDPAGREYYWLTGEVLEGKEKEGTDTLVVKEGKISVTPLKLDLTDAQRIEKLKDILR